MFKKVIIFIVMTAIGISMFTGCTKDQISTNQAKKYIISTDAKYAPFEYEKDGKYIGIDIDILDSIAKSEGFQYELKPMDFQGIIPALTSNQIDGAIAGISITDERKKALDFSDGYFESGISIVVKAGNTSIKSIEDLKGKIFAVKKGTAGAKFAEDNQDKYGATIKYFNDSPSMFQEVINKNADVAFEDYPVIAYKISLESTPTLAIVGEKINKTYYAFAVNKGKNSDLLKKFNDGLKKIKENGEYDNIISKYLGKK